mgnify:CR=1 FL=1
MSKKITWKKVVEDFKDHHPKLAKQVVYWRPHDYMTILIYLKSGTKLYYNCETHESSILNDKWIHTK